MAAAFSRNRSMVSWVLHWHLRALQTRWCGGVGHGPAQRPPSDCVVDCMLKKIGLGVEP